MRAIGTRVVEALKGGLVFGVYAPPIGSLLVSFGMFVALMVSRPLEAIWALPAALGFALGSYLIGGIPAFVTGLLAGWFRSSLDSRTRYLAVGTVGGVLSLLYGVYVFSGSPISGWRGILPSLVFVALPGVFAGTITAFLFRAQTSAQKADSQVIEPEST